MRRNAGILFALFVFLFISVVILINTYYFHFKGNDYLPEGVFQAALSLCLVNVGLRCHFDKNHYLSELGLSIFLLFGLMIILALLTNAVQFTPFPPIDQHLLAFEQNFLNLADLVSWTKTQVTLQKGLATIYDSLVFQMSLLPLLIALFGKFNDLKEYCSLMLISALIGFSFYYFFPTTAPASVINSPIFNTDQYATGLKFFEIHHHLIPSTMEGGLISFPSFHVIWAWFCLYLVRAWTWVFAFLLPFNLLLVLSCVLLGWHYLIDVMAALLVIWMSHGIHNRLASTEL